MRVKLTTAQFILKARDIHDMLYDYGKVIYQDTKTKVLIMCIEHGEFYQTPQNHLSGNGCPRCNRRKK